MDKPLNEKKIPPVGELCGECKTTCPRVRCAWVKPKKGPTRYICPNCEEKLFGKERRNVRGK